MSNDGVPPAERIGSRRGLTVFAWLLLAGVSLGGGLWLGRSVAEGRSLGDLKRARELANRSPIDAAVSAYRRHLERFPDDTATRLELAQLLRRRDPDGALRELRLIGTERRETHTAARLIAALSVEQGRDYDAIEPLRLLENELPDDAGVKQTLAEIHYRASQYDEALVYARSARKLAPKSVELLLLIAEANDDLKRHQEMIEPLETALKLNDELPQAHLNLAYAYELTGRVDDAWPHVNWFVTRFPNSAAGQRLLAKVERGRGHSDEALLAARRASELAPTSMDSAILEAELLLFNRKPAEAYERLKPFAQERPYDRRLIASQLRAMVMCGKQDEARELQERLQRLEARE